MKKVMLLGLVAALAACNAAKETPDGSTDQDGGVVSDGSNADSGCGAAYCCTSDDDISKELVCGVCNHSYYYPVVCQHGAVVCDPMIENEPAKEDGYEVLPLNQWATGDGGCVADGYKDPDGGTLDAGTVSEDMRLCMEGCQHVVDAGCYDSIEGCEFDCAHGLSAAYPSCVAVLHDYLVCTATAPVECLDGGGVKAIGCDDQGHAATACMYPDQDGGVDSGVDSGVDTGADGGSDADVPQWVQKYCNVPSAWTDGGTTPPKCGELQPVPDTVAGVYGVAKVEIMTPDAGWATVSQDAGLCIHGDLNAALIPLVVCPNGLVTGGYMVDNPTSVMGALEPNGPDYVLRYAVRSGGQYNGCKDAPLMHTGDGALVRVRDGQGQYNTAKSTCGLCYQICSDEDKQDIFATQIRETYRTDVQASPCGGETDYCSGFPFGDRY